MVGTQDLVLVDVVVVVVGALLLEPRLYMLRTPEGPCATDAMVDRAVEAPPAFVIQGMTTVEPGHGVAVMVSTCPYDMDTKGVAFLNLGFRGGGYQASCLFSVALH